jgi:hypothetical protein
LPRFDQTQTCKLLFYGLKFCFGILVYLFFHKRRISAAILILSCDAIVSDIIDSSKNSLGLVYKLSNNSIPAIEALSAWLAIGSYSMEASLTSVTVLSTDSRFALALTSPGIASKGIVNTAWIAVTSFALSDFRVAVVPLLA